MAEKRRDVPSRNVTEKAKAPAPTEPKRDATIAFETATDGSHDWRQNSDRRSETREVAGRRHSDGTVFAADDEELQRNGPGFFGSFWDH